MINNLTGECRKAFEKYLRSGYTEVVYSYGVHNVIVTDIFNNSPDSMQWGVIVDFADSEGYTLDVRAIEVPERSFVWKVYRKWYDSKYLRTKTRQEARKAAAKEFNRLFNENQKK